MKRLVCCLDGTWNTPDQEGNPTSVTELMRAVRPADDDGVHQIVFYDKGVGTGGWINRLRGGASLPWTKLWRLDPFTLSSWNAPRFGPKGIRGPPHA